MKVELDGKEYISNLVGLGSNSYLYNFFDQLSTSDRGGDGGPMRQRGRGGGPMWRRPAGSGGANHHADWIESAPRA
jgi:hypothetical protein